MHNNCQPFAPSANGGDGMELPEATRKVIVASRTQVSATCSPNPFLSPRAKRSGRSGGWFNKTSNFSPALKGRSG